MKHVTVREQSQICKKLKNGKSAKEVAAEHGITVERVEGLCPGEKKETLKVPSKKEKRDGLIS